MPVPGHLCRQFAAGLKPRRPTCVFTGKHDEAHRVQIALWTRERQCSKCGDDRHWRSKCPLNRPAPYAAPAAPATPVVFFVVRPCLSTSPDLHYCDPALRCQNGPALTPDGRWRFPPCGPHLLFRYLFCGTSPRSCRCPRSRPRSRTRCPGCYRSPSPPPLRLSAVLVRGTWGLAPAAAAALAPAPATASAPASALASTPGVTPNAARSAALAEQLDEILDAREIEYRGQKELK